MKRKKIVALVICLTFAFSCFTSFAEVTTDSTSNEAEQKVELQPVVQTQPVVLTQAKDTVQDAVYEQKEIEALIKIDGITDIENEQATVVKSAYKFKTINNANICMTLLMIKKYLQSRDSYYKAEIIKIKEITKYKKKVVAQKALARVEKRFAAQRVIDTMVHIKLIEINKYVTKNAKKLTAEQKKIIKDNLKSTLAKYNNHRIQLLAIKAQIQKAKVITTGKPSVNKQTIIKKAKEVKEKASKESKELKQKITEKKEDIKNKVLNKAGKNK
ncbi:MAG: hypothetical protein ACM3KR_10830 [Deltaproteobacteria bacterium]